MSYLSDRDYMFIGTATVLLSSLFIVGTLYGVHTMKKMYDKNRAVCCSAKGVLSLKKEHIKNQGQKQNH